MCQSADSESGLEDFWTVVPCTVTTLGLQNCWWATFPRNGKQDPPLLKAKSARGNIALHVHKSVINLIISEALLKNQVIKELLLFDAQVFEVQVFNCFFSATTVKFEIVL